MRKYVITTLSNYIISIIFEEDRPSVIHAYDNGEEALLGNVYIGRVQNIVKNINSAFVEIDKGMSCFYSLAGKNTPVFLNRKNTDKVCIDDLILVQVSKEAVKSKLPSVSSDISFTGTYIVVSLDGLGEVTFSKKIKDGEYKNAIRGKLLPMIEAGDRKYSLIVRTAAHDADISKVVKEAEELCSMTDELLRKAPSRPAFTCLYRNESEYISDLREAKLSKDDVIITDLPEVYDEILQRVPVEVKGHDCAGSAAVPTLNMYDDRLLPLFKLYRFEKHIKEALSTKVWLKSGAYLVIEPTEALTVIDVNSGKSIEGKKSREETFLKINLEAADEIGRQLSLRNISGIIVIDFINLDDEGNKELLIRKIKEITAGDAVPTYYVEMTKLGLIELTRKKIKRPLHEILKKNNL